MSDFVIQEIRARYSRANVLTPDKRARKLFLLRLWCIDHHLTRIDIASVIGIEAAQEIIPRKAQRKHNASKTLSKYSRATT